MPRSKLPAPRPPALLPSGYRNLLQEIKTRVLAARSRAVLAANRELLVLYWEIGNMILRRQQKEGWGAKVIDRLSGDLQKAFPGQGGFSPRNLKYMRAFATAWPKPAIVQRPAAQIGEGNGREIPIVQQAAAQLPWRHHMILLDRVNGREARVWYATKTIEQGWSSNVLALQIEAGLHRRQGLAVTNFKTTLPPAMSDLAQNITKDPYLFDFLAVQEGAGEKAVENGLLVQVEKFLLELGAGFALVGRQVPLEVGGQDYFLDLLFYHLKLHCYVVIDLKAHEFTPEAAGKMNFYLSAVDDLFRQSPDQPSIGIILCRAKNRIVAEYALRDLRKPIGVSGYLTRLVDSLPTKLQGVVPSAEEMTRGLKRTAR